MPTDDQMKQDQIDKYRELIQQKIREHGWMVQGVFPTTADDGPSFAYTIGMTEAGLPELLMSGNLSHELLMILLNSAAKQHLAEEIKPGDEVSDIASVTFKVVACGPHAPIQQARNYYYDPYNRLGTVRAIQLLWPDKAGAYPGTFLWTPESGDQPIYSD